MQWYRVSRGWSFLWPAVLLACLLPGSLRAQIPEDGMSREYSVYPDLHYGETDGVSREFTIYPDPDPGHTDAASREFTIYPDPSQGQTDGVSREYTVFPDPTATIYSDALSRELAIYPDATYNQSTDAVSREYAFWYFEDETDVKEVEDIPSVLTLRQPQPNPFTGTTKMVFGLPRPAAVSLSLFDVTGRRVQQVILPSMLKAGWHTVTINAGRLSAGIYFCELNAGGSTRKNKLVIRR